MGSKRIFCFLSFFFFLFVATLVYFPALRGGFILDDFVWIQPLTVSQIGHMFVGSWEHGNTLRPIMRLQFFSSLLLFGEQPLYWHLTNILLHTLISFSCFIFVYVTTKNKYTALGAGLIFAIFPGNHEVVAWISGRTHSFGLLLSLVAGYTLYRSFETTRYQYVQLISGFCVLLLAFLTYEVAFAVPLALLAAIIILNKFTRRAVFITLGSGLLLALLVLYRIHVLGSIGSTNQQYTNIFLAPFLNLKGVKDLFLYSRELKILTSILCILLGITAFAKKFWQEKKEFALCLYFFCLTIISYLPFAIVHGVAPRFLYSSFFFFCITLGLLFAFLYKNGSSQKVRLPIYVLIAAILIASAGRTWQVATRYDEVAHGYEIIPAQIKQDFPVWPEGKDIVLYNLPNSNQNILAFLTYIDKAIDRAYAGKINGKVYRAERLSQDKLASVLNKNPIQYQFVSFDAGVKQIETK